MYQRLETYLQFGKGKGPIIFFVRVCVGRGGGGGVNLEGVTEKSRFYKGGNNSKGEKELRMCPGEYVF